METNRRDESHKDMKRLHGLVEQQSRELESLRASLQAERALSRLIGSSVPVGIVLFDSQRTIRWTNDRITAITGYAADDLTGASLAALYDDEEWKKVRGRLNDLREKGQVRGEDRWRRKDGTSVPVHLTLSALDSDSPFLGAVLLPEDMSELKSGERQWSRMTGSDATDKTLPFRDTHLVEAKQAEEAARNKTAEVEETQDKEPYGAEGAKGYARTAEQRAPRSGREDYLLSGLIPICGECKKIRNDGGHWEQIDSYLRSHSRATFSHGLCPQCADKARKEYSEAREKIEKSAPGRDR